MDEDEIDEDAINELGMKIIQFIVSLLGPKRPNPTVLMAVMEKSVGASLRVSYPSVEEQKEVAIKFHEHIMAELDQRDAEDRARPH